MKKIVCVITEVEKESFWLKLSIDSYIKFIDRVVLVEGGKTMGTLKFFLEENFSKYLKKFELLHSPYKHDFKGADGFQRNKYLEHIKKYFEGDLAIVVDSDEVLADDAESQLKGIEKAFEQVENIDVVNPRMHHFIGNFSEIDSTLDYHFCPSRIFKIAKDLTYPEVEHTSLQSERSLYIYQSDKINTPVLYYHYGYVKSKEDLITKYKKHMKKSNIHTPEFLKAWKDAHLFGTFPTKKFLGQHPIPVRKEFLLGEFTNEL